MPYALPLGDPRAAAMSRSRFAQILGEAQQGPAVVCQESPALHSKRTPQFLEMDC
jgi:hypothetical protein